MVTGRLWYPMVAVLVSMVLIAGVTVWYVHREQKRADARWCDILAPLDDAYRANVPATPTGRDVAAAVHKLRLQFGC